MTGDRVEPAADQEEEGPRLDAATKALLRKADEIKVPMQGYFTGRTLAKAALAGAGPSPAVPVDESQLRPEYEQVVTDVLVALDEAGRLIADDGPAVDDARDAVMRTLESYFGPAPVAPTPEEE